MQSSLVSMPPDNMIFGDYSFLWYSRISPGWQSRTSQMASSVEKRTAFTFPVFKLDRLTVDIPTLADSSLSEIFLHGKSFMKDDAENEKQYSPHQKITVDQCKTTVAEDLKIRIKAGKPWK